jgi:hypothetical protein
MWNRLNRTASFKPRKPFARKYRPADSRKGLIALLDEVTSLIVRKRDKVCITCGEARPELLTASHFYSRRWLNVRFDLRNVACQCFNCNCIVHVQNVWPYTNWFLDTYSTDVMAELFELRNRKQTPTNEELRYMLGQYRCMLKEMNN